mmetsp:Transcript_18725/g.30357  ORF Transcript_18725/g.30357 Transcript_18725/m.30357 type:complete len:187 (-) Transcript_18725:121-681(-)
MSKAILLSFCFSAAVARKTFHTVDESSRRSNQTIANSSKVLVGASASMTHTQNNLTSSGSEGQSKKVVKMGRLAMHQTSGDLFATKRFQEVRQVSLDDAADAGGIHQESLGEEDDASDIDEESLDDEKDDLESLDEMDDEDLQDVEENLTSSASKGQRGKVVKIGRLAMHSSSGDHGAMHSFQKKL